MAGYSYLTDMVLESDDFIAVIKEGKSYNTKTFEEFLDVLTDFNERLNNCGIETTLTPDVENGKLIWVVKDAGQADKNSVLQVDAYDNGNVTCNKRVRFALPGSSNLNNLTNGNQILKILDDFVYSIERNNKQDDTKKDNKDQDKKDDNKGDKDKDGKDKDSDYELDDAIVSILDKLKADGESLYNKAKAVPAVEFNGKKYKISDGELMASTEQEVVLALEFPRDQEMDIYSKEKAGRKLRAAIVKTFKRNGFYGDHFPEFRLDMDRTPYFYIPVGKMPVKKLVGPEAEAMLNYYDGKKVRFQPRDN